MQHNTITLFDSPSISPFHNQLIELETFANIIATRKGIIHKCRVDVHTVNTDMPSFDIMINSKSPTDAMEFNRKMYIFFTRQILAVFEKVIEPSGWYVSNIYVSHQSEESLRVEISRDPDVKKAMPKGCYENLSRTVS